MSNRVRPRRWPDSTNRVSGKIGTVQIALADGGDMARFFPDGNDQSVAAGFMQRSSSITAIPLRTSMDTLKDFFSIN
jgi:hypothetical protein